MSLKRVKDAVWRGFLGLGRLLVAWIPALILLFMSGLYLFNCLEVLAAPGTGFDFTYMGRNGAVRLKSESYSIDPVTQSGEAYEVAVLGLNGEEIGRVKKVRVQRLAGTIQVQLLDVDATIRRRTDGSFTAFDLLPPDDPNAVPQPIFVTLNQARVRLIDESRKPQLVDEFVLKNVDFSTDGKLNVIASDLEWGDTLVSRMGGQFDLENRYRVDLTEMRLNLRQARPTLERWLPAELVTELKPWQAESLSAEGNLTVSGDEKGLEEYRGSLAVSGAGIRHSDFFDPSAITAKIELYPGAMELSGRVVGVGQSLIWEGPISWKDKFAASGKLRVEVSRPATLWPVVRKAIPRGLGFERGVFDGSASIQNEKFSVNGNWTLGDLRFAGESAQKLSGNVIANSEVVSVVVDKAVWRGTPVSGWVTENFRRNFVTGILRTDGDRLVRLEFPFESGKVVVAGRSQALISGTPAKPEVMVDLTGVANLNLPDRDVLLGDVDGRVLWKNNVAQIERGILSGPTGTASLSGRILTDTQTIDLEVDLAGMDLSAWQDQVRGVGYGSGRITGKVAEPVVRIDSTVLDVSVGEISIPKGTATVTYLGNQVTASDLNVAYGLGAITGDVQLELDSQRLTGVFRGNDLFVADLVPQLPLIGKVGAEEVLLSGTISEPMLSGRVTGSDILIEGVELAGVVADLRVSGSEVQFENAVAQIGEGTVSANGSVGITSGDGRVEFAIENLPLDKLPVDQELVEIAGQVDGSGVFETDSAGAWVGSSTLRFEGTEINDFDAGSGVLQVGIRDGIVTLSGGLSSLQGLVEVPETTYALESGDLKGELWVTNLEVAGVLRAASRQIRLPDIQSERVVRDLEGLVSAEIAFNKSGEDWRVDVRSLVGQKFESLGRQLGNIELQGVGSANEVTVAKLEWRIPAEEDGQESLATLKGNWKRNADSDFVSMSGRFVEFDPYVLSLLAEDAPEFHASVNADFIVEGDTKNLVGQASAEVSGVQIRGEEGRLIDLPIEANLSGIEFANDQFDILGKLRFRGIEGDLAARIPLSALAENPSGQATADLNLGRRDLKLFSEYLTGVNLDRSEGVVSGRFGVAGDRNGFRLSGSAGFVGPEGGGGRLAFDGTELALQNAKMAVELTDSAVKVSGSADGSLGGTIAVVADLNLQKFLQGDFTLDALMDASFDGTSLKFDRFAFSEKIRLANPAARPGEPAFFEATSPSTGTLNGEVRLAGSVGEPVIQGGLTGRNLNVTLPPAFPQGGGGGELAINPRFDNFRLEALPGSQLNVSLVNMRLNGATVLNGSLSALEIRAPFTVDSGSLTLPSSRVTLEEGTVLVTSGFGGEARAEIDLSGWTVVTARRSGGEYQTYRLNLQVQGNLLNPEGVRINGTSDPPDLSIEEIRAIVGQRDFIESLIGSALGTDRSQLTGSIFSLAIPTLTQGWTTSLARALDLDYLALDYNPFDGAIARGGREMSRGLYLEASRQITQQGNDPLKFELRLSYRPPSRDPFLSRARFNISTTETLPWKVGVTWTTRF
ncbi:hypothetical protein C0431_03135 [bacterium]|nr:hypothetical protein [bacterium]